MSVGYSLVWRVWPSESACVVLVALGVLAGCGGGSAPPKAAEPSAPASVAAAPSVPEPTTVAEIFPPGPGRDAVLQNCGACHNVACSAIGQRTAGRWDNLKAAHATRVADVNLDELFGYLKANFSDAQPEVKVPPKFLEGGCTPF